MREIKLNSVEYLRGKILSASVDEEKLEFINGVALARATVISNNGGGDDVFACYGLIDEHFLEVYADTQKNDFKAQRNLMFMKYNLGAERILDNDFVIKVACGADNGSWIEYRHIRIVDGVPMTVNKIGKYVRTKLDRLVICNWYDSFYLYDISTGKIVTPHLASIRETDENDKLFDVSVEVMLEEGKYGLVDNLFFRIDSKGNIVSSVLSSLENGYLDVVPDETSIEELVQSRKQYLQEREVQFGEELKEFRESIGTTTKGSSSHVIKMVDPNKNNNQ